MGELADLAKKGDKIMIMTCDEKLSPTIYMVTGKSRAVLVLEEVETGKPFRVHKSRVAKILQPEGMKEVQEVMAIPEKEVKEAKKVVVKSKPKEKAERVNFRELQEAGAEVWSKLLEFGDKEGKAIEGVKAEAHCVIAGDHKTFRVFNTFNGSFGKFSKKKREKAPVGVEYNLKDDKAHEKKVKDLQKKGYKRRPSPPKKK